MINNTTSCPVCGFDLGFLPWDNGSASFEICPCCGIQFGYTDVAGGDIEQRILLYADWRLDWIKEGMQWDKGRSAPPDNWDPQEQLKNLSSFKT